MRPKKLEVSGFKSFIQPQTIDFDRLCENNLFCISGDTGSGKSSILDAMIFALYGESGAKIKKNDEFVNTSSKKAVIRLCIEINGKEYTVVRELKKGSSTAKLYDASGVTLKDKPGEVNEFIQSEIGLDRSQFTKVVVLKQGEFDAFLEANKGERTQLIEKLFSLSIYEKAVDLIKADLNKKEQQFENIKTMLTSYEDADKTALENIENGIKEKEKERDDLATSKAKLTENLQALNDMASKYDLWKKTQENIEKTTCEIKNNKDVLNNLQREYENLQEKGKIYLDFDEQINKENEKKERLIEGKVTAQEVEKKEEEREKLVSEYLSLKKTFIQHENKLKILDAKIKAEQEFFGVQNTEDAEKKQKEYDEFYTEISKKASVQKERKKAWEKAKEQSEIAKKEVEKANAIYTATTKEENEKKALRDRLENDFENARELYENEIIKESASHIRAGLKVGDTCPVCGNIVGKEIDSENCQTQKLKEDCEQKKERFESADKAHQDAKTAKSTAVSALSIAQTNYEQRLKDEQDAYALLDGSITDESVMDAKQKSKRADEFVGYIKEYETSNEGLKVARQSLDNTQERGKKAREQIDELKATLTKKFGTYKSVEIGEQIDVISLAVEKAKNEKATFETSLKENADRILKAKTRDEELQKTLENLKMGHTVCAKPNENEILRIKEEIRNQEERLAQIQTEIGKRTSEKAVMQDRLQKKSEIQKERDRVKIEFDTLSVLANLCRGKAFTEYVAEIFIAEFTLLASERLRELTLGQYELNYEDGEFYVTDYLSGGERRSVKTLSGGERFLASLSLAIAISRRTSQSKDYGFFFIDEGFGSLDEKSLVLVSQSLFTLAKDTVVGVITHVKELKERMPTVLQVSKVDGKTGSECKIKA